MKGTPKSRLRAAIKAKRAATSQQERARASAQLCEHLLAHPSFAAARTLACYIALPRELDLAPLIQAALHAGKDVALPKTVGPGLPLRFQAPWREGREPLVRGAFGVMEPKDSAPVVPLARVDLVIVPGLAIDPQGRRLGYGGGYYDRTLPGMTRAVRVMACLDFQRVPTVPTDDGDVRVGAVVTQSGWVALSSG